MFNWKKKTSIFIGRFQPFHQGHKKIFLKTLKNTGQVAILVMNSHNVGTKNPLNFQQVKKKINDRLKKYKKKYIIIKIPVVGEFIYGRKVGYKVKKIIDKKTTKISATKIRAYAKQRFGPKYVKILSKIKVSDLRKIES
jgi:adenylylsulfate kinase